MKFTIPLHVIESLARGRRRRQADRLERMQNVAWSNRLRRPSAIL